MIEIEARPPRLAVFVAGLPIPQGSTRSFAVAGKIRTTHANASKLGVWRSAVTLACRAAWIEAPPLDESVVVVAEFWLPRPASTPKKVRDPIRKPDLDKLGRAVLDSLTDASVLADDARVVTLTLAKYFADERHPIGARISARPTVEEL